MKKLFALILALHCLFLSVIFPVSAENYNNQTIINQNILNYFEEIAREEAAEGYALKDVDVNIYYNDTISENSITGQLSAEPRGILYEIRNVRHTKEEFMYENDYESDYFYGPCTVSETYTKSVRAAKNISVSIGNSTLKSALGYSFTTEYSNSKTFSTSVGEGEYLHLKVYVVYRRSDFDIYNQWTGNLVEQNAWTGKPVGLAFIQARYAA